MQKFLVFLVLCVSVALKTNIVPAACGGGGYSTVNNANRIAKSSGPFEIEIANPAYLTDLALAHIRYGSLVRAESLLRTGIEKIEDPTQKQWATSALDALLHSNADLKAPVGVKKLSDHAEFEPKSTLVASFDNSRFDTISNRLALTEIQWKRVSQAKVEIMDDAGKLSRAYAKAQFKYANCERDCGSEIRKLIWATDEANNYDPRREFEHRLRSILDSSQMADYTKVQSHARQ